MAREPALRVVGGRELRRELKAAGVSLQDLKAAHRAAAEIVARRGQADAPRVSGRLAGNVRAGATQRAAVVRAGGTRVPYAAVVHWGWPRRHIAANPWLSDAAVATESQWVDEYSQEVQKITDTVRGAST